MPTEPTPKVIWLTDRSRILQDWKCPRARYHGYHFAGRGVQPPSLQIELFLGIVIHDGLAAIATQWQHSTSADIDDIASKAAAAVKTTLGKVSDPDSLYPMEQATLVEGLLRGFYQYAWPSLIAQYPKVVAVEQEMTYPLNDEGFVFMSRPDLVLGDTDGNLFYIEYKSTSSKSEEWVNQWNTAVQVHSTVKAIGHTLGTQPAAVIVQGLFKGGHYYGKQNSPFCYAYHRQGTPPFSYPEYSYAYKGGFKKTPVWEKEGGLKQWLADMPENLLAEQFPQTPPIYVNNEIVERFFQQRLLREFEIHEALKVIEDDNMDPELRQQFLDGFFPQIFSACNPGWGKPCGFRQLCFAGGNPLDLGWQPREPHHEPETVFFATQEADAKL